MTPPARQYPLLQPFVEFFRTEAAGGVVLIVCAAAALVWANSPLGAAYSALWTMPVSVGAGTSVFTAPLLFWVNDGLMAVFFLLIGLEIKREVLAGELASPRKAALPLAAALGGMAVPAVLYTALNAGGPGAAGWAVPMATDIAFSLGVLALLGSRAPLALKVFLAALAIADDLGAVVVIAVFYGHGLDVRALAAAAVVLGVLVAMNRAGVRGMWPYLALGLVLWVAVLLSGVHATVAGVLLALTIPSRPRTDAAAFLDEARHHVARYGEGLRPGLAEPTPEQLDSVHALEEAAEAVQTPLRRLEHELHRPVAFGILPLFALANAGVAVGGGDLGALLGSPVALGVVLGLVVGKPAGIFALTWLAVRVGLADRPDGVTWGQLFGVAVLCGIGFTMSIFVATLAFPADAGLLAAAKVGILVGSFASGVLGWALLARSR